MESNKEIINLQRMHDLYNKHILNIQTFTCRTCHKFLYNELNFPTFNKGNLGYRSLDYLAYRIYKSQILKLLKLNIETPKLILSPELLKLIDIPIGEFGIWDDKPTLFVDYDLFWQFLFQFQFDEHVFKVMIVDDDAAIPALTLYQYLQFDMSMESLRNLMMPLPKIFLAIY